LQLTLGNQFKFGGLMKFFIDITENKTLLATSDEQATAYMLAGYKQVTAAEAGAFNEQLKNDWLTELSKDKTFSTSFNKAHRQALLTETDWIAQRHVRQSAALTAAQLEARAKVGKAITTAQFKALENYAQALRDVPETVKAWPTMQAGDWPAKPDWLEAMLQKVAA
jgi:uncharacterized protein YecA (UPF0149 family)